MMIWLASCSIEPVSTYSRPKAAASEAIITKNRFGVSTHSRPKAAAKCLQKCHQCQLVSTHSRPKAAACDDVRLCYQW